MTSTINIPAFAFSAALKCAAKADIRGYINGVYLDLPKGRIVSTDGHRMFIGKIGHDQILTDMPAVLVSRELIESALKSVPKRDHGSTEFAVTIETVNGVASVTIQAGSARFSAPAVDGRFPDYERVYPVDRSGKVASFNPDFIVSCTDALRTYTGAHKATMYPLQHNGDSAALMTANDCLCLVMPMRTDGPVAADWFYKPVALAEAA